MTHAFKTILVPVDLSINTEVAIKKALDLAAEGTVLHLLYVRHAGASGISTLAQRYFTKAGEERSLALTEKKLSEWKKSIEECVEGIEVCTWICMEDSIQKGIEKKAKKLHADLIVISKNSHHSWLPFLNTVLPVKLANDTGIAVLTVKPGAIYNKIRTVLVPITSQTARNKVEALSILSKKFRVKIHLVTFTNDATSLSDSNTSSLLQVYQWLKTSVHCPVEYAVLQGHNKAKAILDYSGKINADILLVHPDTETKIGWPNTHISDVLPPASKVQVLAVQPAGTLFT